MEEYGKVWKKGGKSMELHRAPEGSEITQSMEEYGRVWEKCRMAVGLWAGTAPGRGGDPMTKGKRPAAASGGPLAARGGLWRPVATSWQPVAARGGLLPASGGLPDDLAAWQSGCVVHCPFRRGSEKGTFVFVFVSARVVFPCQCGDDLGTELRRRFEYGTRVFVCVVFSWQLATSRQRCGLLAPRWRPAGGLLAARIAILVAHLRPALQAWRPAGGPAGFWRPWRPSGGLLAAQLTLAGAHGGGGGAAADGAAGAHGGGGGAAADSN
eukprot:gene17760-biopygen7687